MHHLSKSSTKRIISASGRSKDELAGIGLAVSDLLGMRDASMYEILERIESMRAGLRVIATWAENDRGSWNSRDAAMNSIYKMAMECLG